jgi:hypothetical protein
MRSELFTASLPAELSTYREMMPLCERLFASYSWRAVRENTSIPLDAISLPITFPIEEGKVVFGAGNINDYPQRHAQLEIARPAEADPKNPRYSITYRLNDNTTFYIEDFEHETTIPLTEVAALVSGYGIMPYISVQGYNGRDTDRQTFGTFTKNQIIQSMWFAIRSKVLKAKNPKSAPKLASLRRKLRQERGILPLELMSEAESY